MNKIIMIIMTLIFISGCSSTMLVLPLNNIDDTNITNTTTYSSFKIEDLIANINVSGNSSNVNLSDYYNKTESDSLFYLKTNPSSYVNSSVLINYVNSTQLSSNLSNYYLTSNPNLFINSTALNGYFNNISNFTTNLTNSKICIYNSTTSKLQCDYTDQTGGGSGYNTIKDENTSLTQRTTLNFIGTGVSCVDNTGDNQTDCTITSGGSSGSTTYGVSSVIKSQTADVLTTDSVGWANTDMDFDVYADRRYTLLCDIMYTTAVATTGQTINLSTTAGVNNVYIMYDTWSSATANVGLSSTAFNTALTGTGSGATIIKPNLVMATFGVTTNGSINLSFRSEINLSSSNFLRGSKCELFDVSNQTTTATELNGQPARIIQTNDISTTSNTNFVATNMTFNVTSGYTYNLLCNIMYTTAVATTGQAIQLNTTAGVNNVYIMYDTWSSATAPVGFSATAFGTILTGTGSGATIIRPNLLIASFGVTSNGSITLWQRSEISASSSNFLRGSMCQLLRTS